jgi:hypothetical protein
MIKPFVVALVVVALGACSRPAPPPAPPVAPAPKGPTAKEIYELRERCAKDAREWFKQNYSEPQDPVPVKGGGSISSLPPNYENHYSQAHNGCFAVLSQMTSFQVQRAAEPEGPDRPKQRAVGRERELPARCLRGEGPQRGDRVQRAGH